jgi:hypothetical protein
MRNRCQKKTNVLKGEDWESHDRIASLIEATSRTWLRPPYFDVYYIAVFFVIWSLLFIGFLSTKIGYEKKAHLDNNPWFLPGTFVVIVMLFFFPFTLWFCLWGWKKQAIKEKLLVKKMMRDELGNVVRSEQGKQRKRRRRRTTSSKRVAKTIPVIYEATTSSESSDQEEDNKEDSDTVQ